MAAANKHIIIENLRPSVDGGLYPAKAISGEPFTVMADVFRDGHEPLRVFLCWKSAADKNWSETPMSDDKNDTWSASFPLSQVGTYEFSVRASSEGERDETSPVLRVVVDRPLARTGAWYELFVR